MLANIFGMNLTPSAGTQIIEKELSYKLVGIFFSMHQELGRFCRERQHCDAFEQRLSQQQMDYQKEKLFPVAGRNSNRVDFLVEQKVIIDIKAKPVLERSDFDQMKRYLQSSGCRLDLIVNFRSQYLHPRRVLNPTLKQVDKNS